MSEQKPVLKYAVHDIPDEDGKMHVFVPGDDVPEWAWLYITNPTCWVVAPIPVDEDKPKRTAQQK